MPSLDVPGSGELQRTMVLATYGVALMGAIRRILSVLEVHARARPGAVKFKG